MSKKGVVARVNWLLIWGILLSTLWWSVLIYSPKTAIGVVCILGTISVVVWMWRRIGDY